MKNKKIEIISPADRNIIKLESIKEYLKKKVVSKSGEIIGKVRDVLFTEKGGIKGIVVSKGFFSKSFYVDKSYLQAVSDKAMLSIDPVILLAGKIVFDADGRKLGKIISVVRKDNTNNFQAIVIKKRIYSKAKEIPKSDIDVMKKNIILNKIHAK